MSSEGHDKFWIFSSIAVALTVFTFTMAPSLAWRQYGDDGGELTLAAAYLGVPHPSGYPSYNIFGWLFTLIPIGDCAYRTNLLSVLSGAFCAGCFTYMVMFVSRALKLSLPGWSCFLFGLYPVMAYTMWGQSLITEVYAFNVCFCALSITLLIKWVDSCLTFSAKPVWFFRAAIVFALSLGGHLKGLFILPGIIFVIATTDRSFWKRSYFWYAIAGGTGMFILVHCLLPLFALGCKPINWGNIKTDLDFWNHVTGAQYKYRMFAFSVSEVANRFRTHFIPLLGRQWGEGSLILLLAGMIHGFYLVIRGKVGFNRQKLRTAFSCWLCLWAIEFVYSINYRIDDIDVYFCWTFAMLALLFPLGATAFRDISRRLSPIISRSQTAFLIAAMCPMVGVLVNAPEINMRNETRPLKYGEEIIAELSPGSVLLSDYDGRTNSLMYQKYLGRYKRDDVVIILRSMLAADWYRDQLRMLFPHLYLPEPSAEILSQGWESTCAYVTGQLISGNPGSSFYALRASAPGIIEYEIEAFHGIFRIITEKEKSSLSD